MSDDHKQILPGVTLLGLPYDITGAYANASAVNLEYPLFDIGATSFSPDDSPDSTEAMVYQKPYYYPSDHFAIANWQESIAVDVDYKQAEDNAMSLNAGVSAKGQYALFSGGLKVDFQSSYASSTYFESLTRRSLVRSYSLSLTNPSDLKNCLTPQADKDINGPGELSPDELIAKYATHVLISGVFGGILTYSQSLSKLQYTTSMEVQSQLDANYAGYGSAAVYGGISTQSNGGTTQSNAVFQAWGGNAETLKQGYDAWAASVDQGNFVLIDFPTQGTPLMPISELASDPARQQAILDAINAKLEAMGPPITERYDLRWDKTRRKTIYVRTDVSVENSIEVDDESQIIVGYGAHIASSSFTRSTIQMLDLSTNKLVRKVSGNVSTYSAGDYDSNLDITTKGVRGVALTGVAMRADSSSLKSLKLYYQELDPSLSSDFVADTVETYIQNNSGWEADYPPENHDLGWVIVGVAVGASNNGNNVRRLNVDIAPLIRVKRA